MNRQYNIKWTTGNESMQSFEQFFDEGNNFEAMIKKVKEMTDCLATIRITDKLVVRVRMKLSMRKDLTHAMQRLNSVATLERERKREKKSTHQMPKLIGPTSSGGF